MADECDDTTNTALIFSFVMSVVLLIIEQALAASSCKDNSLSQYALSIIRGIRSANTSKPLEGPFPTPPSSSSPQDV